MFVALQYAADIMDINTPTVIKGLFIAFKLKQAFTYFYLIVNACMILLFYNKTLSEFIRSYIIHMLIMIHPNM